MPKCPKCKADIDHLHAYAKETNKYEVYLEGCPSDIPVPLRGKSNACLMGGPKTEDYPGGQFCSHLEKVGKCKIEGDYTGLDWSNTGPTDSSADYTEFCCPECEETLYENIPPNLLDDIHKIIDEDSDHWMAKRIHKIIDPENPHWEDDDPTPDADELPKEDPSDLAERFLKS